MQKTASGGAADHRPTLTPRRLNRATLARQLLLRREPMTVPDAVRRIVAVQAQEPASPYLALWNRLVGFDPADLDTAFADRVVVRSTLLRGTLHAVHAGDWPAFHTAMAPFLRSARLDDLRFAAAGLTVADADALLPHLATFLARPRTGVEIQEMLASRLADRSDPTDQSQPGGESPPGDQSQPGGRPVPGDRHKWLWWALRTYAPMHHVPTGGPWSYRIPASFVAAPDPLDAPAHADSVRSLVLRYLAGFGPASARDIAQFSLLRTPVLRQAVDALGDRVVRLTGPDGAPLFDVPGAPLPPEETPAPPRLLPMWDSVLLGYADRSRVVPPEYRTVITRRNGDVLPTLLVDGRVAGVWRPTPAGVEATAFHRLDEATWEGLAAEARAMVGFLAGRDPAAYRRYGHWWDKGLPGVEVRVLPG
ncbi:winged helix DNA-binding domain-containing protein [Plantactinospora sp. B5E13]|uniref:winged helix DNA-binding domain-containing protein n=1 Tax=unclassified Plantactinospora TaxID=2631981 RepID=UPI00325C47AD